MPLSPIDDDSRDCANDPARACRHADWHSVRVFGAKLATVFIFLAPLVALLVELLSIVLTRQSAQVVGSLQDFLLICAAAVATMIVFAFKGDRNGKH